MNRKAQLSSVALGIIITIVSLFIGLFMITNVSEITAINNTSDFYSIYTNLVSSTSTIFEVIVLVIIIVALGLAIAILKGFGGGGGETVRV